MKKRLLKAVSMILIIVTASFLLTACQKDDGAGYTFKYSLSNDPQNLDPQMAVDEPSLIVIRNLYLGLLKQGETGNLLPGVAADYSVSSDGLTYTFHLNNGYHWQTSDTEQEPVAVTANDFVFAFKRLVDPETKSPYAQDFFIIKNAEDIYRGKEDISSLGINAKDDYTLEIELEYASANFLSLLTTTPTMPCNEELFLQTRGKYGLSAEAIISNGPFNLSSWIYDPYGKDNYLILRRNADYNEQSRVYPYSISFIVDKNESERVKDFFDATTDIYFDDGTSGDFFANKYNYKEYENASSGLMINPENTLLNIPEVKKALSISLNRELLSSELPNNLSVADGLFPSSVRLLNKEIREIIARDKLPYDSELAQYLWMVSLTDEEKGKLTNSTMIVPQSYAFSDYIAKVTEQWNSELGFYCRIEVLTDAEYNKKLSNGEYSIALVELRPSQNTPISIFGYFKSGESLNRIGFSDKNFETMLSKIEKIPVLSDSVSAYREIENYLIDEYLYMPLFYQKEFLFMDKSIEDLTIDPFTRQVVFENAKKF